MSCGCDEFIEMGEDAWTHDAFMGDPYCDRESGWEDDLYWEISVCGICTYGSAYTTDPYQWWIYCAEDGGAEGDPDDGDGQLPGGGL